MYNILLCKLDKKQPTTPGAALMFEKVHIIATAANEAQALKTAQYYSALYQRKGLYNICKPSHIVTYKKA